jgi:hypothetical protein
MEKHTRERATTKWFRAKRWSLFFALSSHFHLWREVIKGHLESGFGHAKTNSLGKSMPRRSSSSPLMARTKQLPKNNSMQ